MNKEMPIVTNDMVYIDKVLADTQTGAIRQYTLKYGEHLLDAPLPPSNMVLARWTGTKWQEIATPEEIAAHKAAQDAEMSMLT